MKVIAENRDIIYSNSCGCSNANGELTSNFSAEEKRAMFQKWANANKGLNLRVDGTKDDATTAAYKKFGAEYEKTLGGGIKDTRPATKPSSPSNKGIGGVLDTIASTIKPDETNPPVSATKTPEQEKSDKKKKMIKIALIAGGVIALTTIIILIARKKK